NPPPWELRRQVPGYRGRAGTEGLGDDVPGPPGIHGVGDLTRRRVLEHALRIGPLAVLLELVLELDVQRASEDRQIVLHAHPVAFECTHLALAAVIDGRQRHGAARAGP